MIVQMQTDLPSKQVRGYSTSHPKDDSDMISAQIQIDGEVFDLLKTDVKSLRDRVMTCRELKIFRGKGRLGRVFNEFMFMLKKERRDIFDLGDELYVTTKAR